MSPHQAAVNRVIRALLLLLGTMVVGVGGFYWIEGHNLLDSIYMTVITMSTVGYGTLHGELSDPGKVFVIFLIIFTIGTFLNTITTVTAFFIEGEIQTIFRRLRVNKEVSRLENHVVVCGLGRNGKEAALELLAQRVSFVAVEKDKAAAEAFLEAHPDALIVSGDATDEEVLRMANVQKAKGIICALADDAANVFVTLTVKELNPDIEVVARASNETTISKLRRAGASRVILPNVLGGRQMAKVMIKPALIDFVDMITGQGQFHLNLEMVDCDAHSHLAGRTFRDLDIKGKTGVLVIGVQDRTGSFQVNPEAGKAIVTGDKLFVLGTDEQIAKFKEVYLVV